MSFNSWQHRSDGKNSNNNRNQTIPKTNRTDGSMRNTTTDQNPTNQSSTFDKLITYLTKIHPEYSILDFTEALSTYRQEQQTLAGIPLKQIEDNVMNIIRRKYPSSIENVASNIPPENEDADETEQSIAAVLWRTFKRFREQQSTSDKLDKNDQTTNEEKCTICLENLSLHKTETFSCQHTFHRTCLEEWFKFERICPLCRTILLFKDEYPDLK